VRVTRWLPCRVVVSSKVLARLRCVLLGVRLSECGLVVPLYILRCVALLRQKYLV